MKDNESEFYIVRHYKEQKPKSILKVKSYITEEDTEQSADGSERNSVFFNLQENEIKNFTRNDVVTWRAFKLKRVQSTPNASVGKGNKKKGKGKNRRKTKQELEQMEIDKIKKADKLSQLSFSKSFPLLIRSE